MKKITALLFLLVTLVSLAACSAKKEPTEPTTVREQLTLPGEDSLLFGSVPKPDAELTRYNSGRNDTGYTYQWEFNGMSYEAFKAYVDELKKAEFTYYSTSAYASPDREPAFKKTAKECGYTAS